MNCKWLPLALLAACAPARPAPDTHVAVGTYLPGHAVQPGAMTNTWWTIFGSPALNTLEEQGLAANPSIDQARQTLAAAAASAAAANGAYMPQVVLGPSNSPLATRASYPTGPNGAPPYTIYSVTGQISYDPGLFGARHSTWENGQAQVDYAAAALDAARQSVAGNIAAAALTLAGLQAQTAASQHLLAAQQALLALLQGEAQLGAVAQTVVLQQQIQVQAAQQALPALATQAQQAQDRLAILTGTLPGDFSSPPLGFTVPANVPVVLPSTYLANRPDLRAARAQVAAQDAALGVAVAHLYPDVSLTAQGGYAAETLGALFNPASALWTLAGNLLVPVYEGGTLHAQKDAAQAQLAAALAAYRGAVLGAFGEAADALSAVQNSQSAYATAQDGAHTAQAALTLAQGQYRLGAVDASAVLTAQVDAAQADLTLAQARTGLLLAIATLQEAMAK